MNPSIVIIVPPIPRRCRAEHCVPLIQAYPWLVVGIGVVLALTLLWVWFW